MRDKKKAPYPGVKDSVFTEKLDIIRSYPTIPTFRIMDPDGKIADASKDPQLSKEDCLKIYENMVTLNTMDNILYDTQRQGRISFYMTHYGEEGTLFGTAQALTMEDVIFGQYREAGVLLHRGVSLSSFVNQCTANVLDVNKGRQMPVHYGSREANFQTISSPLATQIPQAAGAAYALKRAGKEAVAACYFGEGAASEGDFHAALNIASTVGAPVLFICRNNGFAISTPADEQYRGDGIAARGHGYGIPVIRVDGNDVLAVYSATKSARDLAISTGVPVLLEAMTYRVSHHSTSDDSSAYREKKEVEAWKRYDSPMSRFRQYLEHKGWWSEEAEKVVRDRVRKEVLEAFIAAEKMKKPPISYMFDDVFDTLSSRLKDQKKEVEEMVGKYPDFYEVARYANEEDAKIERSSEGLP
ncbi:hypothetical protein M427DRAFT_30087 [Gonapodya prolifera JEL478]|uniref:2-oxoisovalerate dehydrogenase subunit alpha n=1 Tax=Gonapodya prolifera (strain JEL478) TaxID=1344416 RepID=A0A139ANA1_GONPJ|nr:hypothetical protein M427DRAFT_30087 [Gonapodya prolifera JEL478]|eukprot:KXS17985.1 hypothetical protein M427DRAFT_30087 [Gonapodya prolifera JEL478]